jgi:hypothetical protein
MVAAYQEILDKHRDSTAAIQISEPWLPLVAVAVDAVQAVQLPMDLMEDQEADVEAVGLLTPVLLVLEHKVHNHLPVVAQLVVGDILVDIIQTCHNILVLVVVVLVVLAMTEEMADLLQVVKVV